MLQAGFQCIVQSSMADLPVDIEGLLQFALRERAAKDAALREVERERAAKEAAIRDLEHERRAKEAAQEAARIAGDAAAHSAAANHAAAKQNFPLYGTSLYAVEYAFALCAVQLRGRAQHESVLRLCRSRGTQAGAARFFCAHRAHTALSVLLLSC